MSNVINLKRFRKQQARITARQQADENAARHGETKAARQLRLAQTALENRRLDQSRRDPEEQGTA